jgi:hypothetical protein
MSLCKIKHEQRVILDFSDRSITKNLIQNSIRRAEILGLANVSKTEVLCIENEIKVGPYYIQLVLDYNENYHKLRDYGLFQIRIFECIKTRQEINTSKDYRFKNLEWIKNNNESKIRIKDLIEVIFYCNRLNKLKAFL